MDPEHSKEHDEGTPNQDANQPSRGGDLTAAEENSTTISRQTQHLDPVDETSTVMETMTSQIDGRGGIMRAGHSQQDLAQSGGYSLRTPVNSGTFTRCNQPSQALTESGENLPRTQMSPGVSYWVWRDGTSVEFTIEAEDPDVTHTISLHHNGQKMKSVETSTRTTSISDLKPRTEYQCSVRSRNVHGHESDDFNFSFTTNPGELRGYSRDPDGSVRISESLDSAMRGALESALRRLRDRALSQPPESSSQDDDSSS